MSHKRAKLWLAACGSAVVLPLRGAMVAALGGGYGFLSPLARFDMVFMLSVDFIHGWEPITAMRFYKVTFVSIGVHSWFMIRTFGKIITGNTFLTSGICDAAVALECDPPIRGLSFAKAAGDFDRDYMR